MKLTNNQARVLEQLTAICRRNVMRQKEWGGYQLAELERKLAAGDSACPFGLGGLTFQVGAQLKVSTDAVLSVFKALERKGLVIREKPRGYHCALYWWPAGLAAKLNEEIQARDANQ